MRWPSITPLLARSGRPILAASLALTLGAARVFAQFVDATTGPLGDRGFGAGVAWGDYDNDGDLDLYLANYGGPNKLFRNEGNGTFVDATSGLLGDTHLSTAAAWGDYDNDGDLDLFVANILSTNRLFRNEGNGAFVDVTRAPLVGTGYGVGVAWVDYDNDGNLDLYLVNYSQSNRLFRNLGNGAFVDATTNTLGNPGVSAGAAWGDYDNDGDLDVYIVNVNQSNKLLRNEGDGVFVDATTGVLADPVLASACASWGDYDNDGNLDLFVGNDGVANRLYHNQGDGTFVDVAGDTPLGGATAAVGAAWGDYDNDGDLDLCVVPGGPTSRLFRNDGGGRFVDVAGAPLTSIRRGQGVAWGDYDNDGRLDLYVSSYGSANMLFRNVTPNGSHWLEVKLRGMLSNRAAIGARVEVRVGGVTMIRELSGGAALGSQDAPVASFGLGNATAITRLKVRWPNGIVQVVTPPPAVDQAITVVESGVTDATRGPLGDLGSGAAVAWGDYDNDGDLDLYLANAGQANKLFRNDGGAFVDITGGPLGDDGNGRAVAWGDFDNDGDLDLYLANDGSANRLFRNDGGGTFVDVAAGTPLADAGPGQGVAWGDYDGDGDLDLYLSNFGSANRLFRSDGGTFVDVAPGTPLADAGNGQGVAWADYDGDGDLDLYLVNFGQANRLFRNDGGTFVDVAPGSPLADAGPGRGAAWGDYDNDGDLDLYLVNFLGAANRLFRNDDGTFVDATSGPLADTGNGRGATWGDYDNDGDLDLYLADYGSADRLFRNDGGGTFVDVAGDTPLADAGFGVAVAWGDYDNDGDLDLYLAKSGQANKLLRNDLASNNHWLQVGLWGTVSNRAGIGARVTVVAGGVTRTRELSGGSGYGSQDALVASFGLGPATAIDSLFVRWPSGTLQPVTLPGPGVDRRVTFTETGSPTLLSLFEATWIGEGVELRLEFGEPDRITGWRLERADAAGGPWTPVAAARRDLAATIVLLDRGVEPGRTYRYRLIVYHLDGSTLTFGPLIVTAAVRAFALESLVPNPSTGPVEVEFTVTREAHVRLTVLDLQGRQLALLADGVYPPGRYPKPWNGTTASGRARPGLYFVRLEWPGGSTTRRLAMIP